SLTRQRQRLGGVDREGFRRLDVVERAARFLGEAAFPFAEVSAGLLTAVALDPDVMGLGGTGRREQQRGGGYRGFHWSSPLSRIAPAVIGGVEAREDANYYANDSQLHLRVSSQRET